MVFAAPMDVVASHFIGIMHH